MLSERDENYIRHALKAGRYQRDVLYGDGHAGEAIAATLATAALELHKPFVPACMTASGAG